MLLRRTTQAVLFPLTRETPAREVVEVTGTREAVEVVEVVEATGTAIVGLGIKPISKNLWNGSASL